MRRIDRAAALARIAAGPPSDCVPCDLARCPDPLARSAHAVAVLTRYPVRWGHVMVILRAHAERLGDVAPEVWADASRLAHAAAVAVERALDPARCYVASLGTSDDSLPMTFPHLHLHVIPVADPAARPSDVLTWRNGIVDGAPDEWAALRARLLDVWPR